jgi:DNA-binding response OmpR family regulator
MRILVVEDDAGIGTSLKAGLEEHAFTVDLINDGEKGSYMARTNEYDMVILDDILPNRTGAEITKELRRSGRKMPILMLTVQTDVSRKIEVLNNGADDYMTKPFSFGELLARIQAVMRRPPQLQTDSFVLDDLKVDVARQEVNRAGEDIYLTRKEFQLLEYLLRNVGCVLSRGQILEHVWDVNADPFSNTIETHILNLRKKIDTQGRKKLIYTVPGRGYKIALGK